MNKKFPLVCTLLANIFLSANVMADALCVEDNVLKCKDLGYTESSCAYGGVACQYDTSLWYCAKWTCADGRLYTAQNKPAGAECVETAYKNLTCYDCKEKVGCINKDCAIGDVFYSDGTCCPVEDFDENKIPVGVVYALSETEEGIPYDTITAEKTTSKYGRVINLANLASNKTTHEFEPSKPYLNNNQVYFGLDNTDIKKLSNLSSNSQASTIKSAFNYGYEHVFNGKSNTILHANAIGKHPSCINESYKAGTANYNRYCAPTAAKATLLFYPPEVSSSDKLVGPGNWYLPAIGELALLYGIDTSKLTGSSGSDRSAGTATTKNIVNNTLNTLKNKGINIDTVDAIYWSSTENNNNDVWAYSVASGYFNGNAHRNSVEFLRASLMFPLKEKQPDSVCEVSESVNCENKNCAIGDVFYSDGTCCPVAKFDANKTPVGVVYALSATKGSMPYTTAESEADGFTSQHGRVIALRVLSFESNYYLFDPKDPFDSNTNYIRFGLNDTVVEGLTNYANNLLLTAFQNNDAELYQGKNNTAVIASTPTTKTACINGNIKKGTSNYNTSCVPAAVNATLAFYPLNVEKNDPLVGAGNWYLPSIGELALLWGLDVSKMTSSTGKTGVTNTTKNKVEATLNTLATKCVDADTYRGTNTWSSTLSSEGDWMWELKPMFGERYSGTRTDSSVSVLPSLEF